MNPEIYDLTVNFQKCYRHNDTCYHDVTAFYTDNTYMNGVWPGEFIVKKLLELGITKRFHHFRRFYKAQEEPEPELEPEPDEPPADDHDEVSYDDAESSDDTPDDDIPDDIEVVDQLPDDHTEETDD